MKMAVKRQRLVAFAPVVYTRTVPESDARALKTLSFVSGRTGSAILSGARCKRITLSAHANYWTGERFSVSGEDPCELAWV